MARNLGPVVKKCKSYGIAPQVMGVNKDTKRNPVSGNRKKSEYGLQLNEKQKAKFIYGMKEKQFRNLFARAEKMRGQTGENLITLLELRFDNVVYRMGLASTRAQARQLISHGHFTINGNKVDIPSYTCELGDVVAVKEKSRSNSFFKSTEDKVWNQVSWLSVDSDKLEAKIETLPTKENLDYEIEEHLIVELYSK